MIGRSVLLYNKLIPTECFMTLVVKRSFYSKIEWLLYCRVTLDDCLHDITVSIASKLLSFYSIYVSKETLIS